MEFLKAPASSSAAAASLPPRGSRSGQIMLNVSYRKMTIEIANITRMEKPPDILLFMTADGPAKNTA